MNIKRIIQEEMDDLQWMDDISGDPIRVGMRFIVDNKSIWDGVTPFKHGEYMTMEITGIVSNSMEIDQGLLENPGNGDEIVTYYSKMYDSDGKLYYENDDANNYRAFKVYIDAGYYRPTMNQ